MIFITRPAVPRILARKSAQWLLALQTATTPKQRDRAQRKYRHDSVKQALVNMFHGKCAYCESHIVHVDYGHIEHFHPKNGPCARPDLCFAWTNLLLACGICNGGQFKSDRFPNTSEGGPLIDPCREDPSLHFQFRFDAKLGLASVYGITRRGETTAALLGLNRQELRAYRSRQIKKLAVLKRFAATDAAARHLLEEAAKPTSEYSAFARLLT